MIPVLITIIIILLITLVVFMILYFVKLGKMTTGNTCAVTTVTASTALPGTMPTANANATATQCPVCSETHSAKTVCPTCQTCKTCKTCKTCRTCPSMLGFSYTPPSDPSARTIMSQIQIIMQNLQKQGCVEIKPQLVDLSSYLTTFSSVKCSDLTQQIDHQMNFMQVPIEVASQIQTLYKLATASCCGLNGNVDTIKLKALLVNIINALCP